MAGRPAVRALVSRLFAAPPERVFDAWLSHDALGRWMFGPAVRDEEIVHLAVTPRVGGRFSVLVSQGEEKIEHTGRYLELDRPRRLAYTWVVGEAPIGSRVVVEVVPAGAGCELRVTQEVHPSWAPQVPLIEAAWRTMFDALAAEVE